MQKSSSNVVQTRVPGNWGSLLVLVGFVLIGMAVGNILAVILVAIYTGTDAGGATSLLNEMLTNPALVKNGWNAMMILQGTAHLFSYLIPCMFFWFYMERRRFYDFSAEHSPSVNIWFLTFILVLIFIPLNSQFIEWNSRMSFPEPLSWIEKWMRQKEDQLTKLTSFLTGYTQLKQLMVALIVIVLLPALGEEMLFRGIIQRKLSHFWKNPHLAIWVSAIIFSAIHFQFYGFIPRMLLGALFGYLYFWSGSLWIAIFAHFINNGFVLLMMYLYNIKILKVNLEETKTMPAMVVISSMALTFLILYVIRRETLRDKLVI